MVVAEPRYSSMSFCRGPDEKSTYNFGETGGTLMAERHRERDADDTERHLDRYSDRGTVTPWYSSVAMILLGILAVIGATVYSIVAWVFVLVGGIGTVVSLVQIVNGSSGSDLSAAWSSIGVLVALFAVGTALIVLAMWKLKVSVWQTIPWWP
jgi:hypothetical protein